MPSARLKNVQNRRSEDEAEAGANRPRPWKSRILGHGLVDPAKLKAHPENFKLHGEEQTHVFDAAVAQLGFLRSVTVNKRTGRLIDGHMRVAHAIARGQKRIEVEYVDLSPTEERAALASMDPLGALAEFDQRAIDSLLEGLPDFAKDAIGTQDETRTLHVKTGVKVKVGPHRFQVATRTFKRWAKALGDDPIAEIKRRLQLD